MAGATSHEVPRVRRYRERRFRLAQCLIASGSRPRVFVRDETKARALFGDEVEIHIGDLAPAGSSLDTAMARMDGIFLLTDGPDLDTQDRAISAVRAVDL